MPGQEDREIVCVGWDGQSKPIYRYADELHLNDSARAVVQPSGAREPSLRAPHECSCGHVRWAHWSNGRCAHCECTSYDGAGTAGTLTVSAQIVRDGSGRRIL